MALTSTQKTILKNDINASEFAGSPNTNAQNSLIAAAYNLAASPDYWAWRTSVSRADIYHGTSPDGTTWNWTTYKNQGATEQNAWVQMFMGDTMNMALANARAGIASIFAGSAQANAQRDHCLSVGRRKATRAEKLYVIDTPGSGAGRGTAADPDTLTFEGNISMVDVEEARNS